MFDVAAIRSWRKTITAEAQPAFTPIAAAGLVGLTIRDSDAAASMGTRKPGRAAAAVQPEA